MSLMKNTIVALGGFGLVLAATTAQAKVQTDPVQALIDKSNAENLASAIELDKLKAAAKREAANTAKPANLLEGTPLDPKASRAAKRAQAFKL